MQASLLKLAILSTIISTLSCTFGQPTGAWLIRNCQDVSSRKATVPKWTCQVGSRGPCQDGQVFSLIPPDEYYSWFDIRNDCPSDTPQECQDLASHTEEEDHLLAEVKWRHGVCLWDDTDHPCFGYPGGFRLDVQSGRCFLPEVIDVVCQGNQVFRALNRTHGECKCLRQTHEIWRANGACYQTGTQGPCEDDHWFVLSHGVASCQPITCKVERNGQQQTIDWITAEGRVNCKGIESSKELEDLDFLFLCSSSSLNGTALGDTVTCRATVLLDDSRVFHGENDCYVKKLQASNGFLLVCSFQLDVRFVANSPTRRCASGMQFDRRGNCREVFFFKSYP